MAEEREVLEEMTRTDKTSSRKFKYAVFWILRTGAPWRDLPQNYGDWKNTHRRFCRWRDKDIGKGLLEELILEAGLISSG